jgi:hypothetical protein
VSGILFNVSKWGRISTFIEGEMLVINPLLKHGTEQCIRRLKHMLLDCLQLYYNEEKMALSDYLEHTMQ